MGGGGIFLADIPSAYRNDLIVNLRFKIYNDFLEIHGDKYEQVLVCDTRDVIFQNDVFALFKDCVNWLGYSTELLTIGEERRYNYPWIKICFGKVEADKLSDKKVICAGTIIATTREMKIFCSKMWEIVKQNLTRNFDQGTMNYLVWNKLLPIENLIENDVDSGEILTNGQIKDNKIRDDKILRGDGGVPAVVHQYDRHQNLVQLVDNIYRDRNFQADERFIDPRSTLEQVKQLLYIGKLDEAARFFMNTHGADFGGEIDRLLKIWEMLLSRPFLPAVGYLELSMQNALVSVKNLPQTNLDKICSLLVFAIKNRRAVDPRFVNMIAGGLLNLAGQFVNARAAAPCFFCLDAIKALELPPNKDFYLLQAKAFRTFGRKDEALAAYKQALDLD